jgi:hypothetical protein
MADHEQIDTLIAELRLEMGAAFVPFTRSRSATRKLPSLNWRVRLRQLSPIDGQEFRGVVETDYTQGWGHVELPKGLDPRSLDGRAFIQYACEHGRYGIGIGVGRRIEPPHIRDVLYSLVTDAMVLDYGSFEDWAPDAGYDTDSRKGEAIYRECLALALKLRNLIGDGGLTKLREAYQDY